MLSVLLFAKQYTWRPYVVFNKIPLNQLEGHTRFFKILRNSLLAIVGRVSINYDQTKLIYFR